MLTFCHYDLSSCLMNASGCFSTTRDQLEQLSKTPSCAMVVTKSATLLPQQGHDHPRLFIDNKNCINSIGLANMGLDYYNAIALNKTMIQSVYPTCLDDLKVLLNTTSPIVEINLSCPNSNIKMVDTYESYFQCISALAWDKMIGIKMPPLFYSHEFDNMAHLLLKYKIDFITCCNTIPNCLLIHDDATVLHPNDGFGGMAFKPLALANVHQFYKRLGNQVTILGCGDIRTGEDVMDYILVGATMVQIGAQLLREGPDCFQRIDEEFQMLLKQKGLTLSACRGQLKRCSKL